MTTALFNILLKRRPKLMLQITIYPTVLSIKISLKETVIYHNFYDVLILIKEVR